VGTVRSYAAKSNLWWYTQSFFGRVSTLIIEFDQFETIAQAQLSLGSVVGTLTKRGMMFSMTRQHILDEIRRTAKENGGVPLGHKRFEQETGIRYHDWWGKLWARWSDALRDAGLPPNTLQDAFNDDVLIEKLIAFIRELGHFPGTGDLRLKKYNDATFPNDKVFDSHFGSRARLRNVVIEYCSSVVWADCF